MGKSNKVYLEDIIQAIKVILDEYVTGFDFEKFDKDKKTQDAVIRERFYRRSRGTSEQRSCVYEERIGSRL